jgi:hypothetical protein
MNGQNVVRPANGWNVSTAATSISTQVYDIAGSASFSIFTRVNGADYPATAAGVVVTHPQIPGPPTPQKFEHNFSSPASSDSFVNLFPFNSQYSAYPLACAGVQAGSATYPFTVPRGGAANSGNPIRMQLPSVNVTATRDGAAYSGMDVKLRPQSGTCLPTRSWVTTSTETQPAPYGNRGVPPGTYTLCVDDNTPTTNSEGVSQTVTVGATDLTVPTINIKSSNPGRTPNLNCP